MIKRKLILWISFFVIIFAILVIIFNLMTHSATVSISGNIFNVEVADTSYLLEKGLSGHEPLESNQGMFFVFGKSDVYGIWMKDMLFPIDIIWIDENLKIVHIEKEVSPETYPKVFYPDSPARYVLEISSGRADLLKIKKGDSVKLTEKWL